MNTVIERLREPSTQSGIAYMFMAASYLFPAYSGLIIAIGSVFGFNAMRIPEGGK